MLLAHLVPGYFAAATSRSRWQPEWTDGQQRLLWAVALGSTVVPDLDVVYNALVRGFFNHSTLWTHSVFVYLGLGLLWCVLHVSKRWPFLRVLIGLATVGGLSHLALDVIAHGTPLLYPVSMTVFGIAPARVVEGGVWAYLTDPIFLFEPLLLCIAIVHWLSGQQMVPRVQKLGIVVTIGGLLLFVGTFVALLPILQSAVAPLTVG
jgi:hypothetical protein